MAKSSASWSRTTADESRTTISEETVSEFLELRKADKGERSKDGTATKVVKGQQSTGDTHTGPTSAEIARDVKKYLAVKTNKCVSKDKQCMM